MHLLVDGYNVIHGWPELRKMLRRGLDTAAAVLVERLRVLHDFERVHVSVIFDGKGTRIESATLSKGDVEVLYAPAGVSADALLEQVVCRASDPSQFTVASRDNMVRETIFALGARALTPEELMEWVEQAERRQSADIARRLKDTDKNFGNRLF